MQNIENTLDSLYVRFQSFLTGQNGHVHYGVVLLLLVGVCAAVIYWRRRRRSLIPRAQTHTLQQKAGGSEDLELLRTFVVLSDVAKSLTAIHNRKRLQDVILEKFHDLFPFMEEVCFFSVETDAGGQRNLILAAQRGVKKSDPTRFSIPWRSGLIGKACEQEMILWRDELENRFGRHVASEDGENHQYSPTVAVPLTIHGQFYGCVTLQGGADSEARALHHRLLSILRDLCSLAIANTTTIESLDASNRQLNEQSTELSEFNKNLRLKVQAQVAELREQQHHLMQTEQLAIFGEFVATFAHDIKNPLAFIAGEAQWSQELLADSGTSPQALDRPGLLKSIETIRKNSARLQDDIQTLVGKLKLPKLTRQKVSLTDMLEDLMFLVHRHAEKKGLRLEHKMPREQVAIDAYPGLLRHALMNLISNSLSVMKSGDRLTVTLSADAEKVRIAIEDTGPGIDPEDMPRLFQLFHSRREGGTGLGLYSVRRVVEKQHRGKVSVQSQVGKGTRFDIELPRQADDSEGQSLEDSF